MTIFGQGITFHYMIEVIPSYTQTAHANGHSRIRNMQLGIDNANNANHALCKHTAMDPNIKAVSIGTLTERQESLQRVR